jgi:hypothetical protein
MPTCVLHQIFAGGWATNRLAGSAPNIPPGQGTKVFLLQQQLSRQRRSTIKCALMMFPLVALCVCALLVHGCPRSVLLLSDPLFVLAARALVGRVFFFATSSIWLFFCRRPATAGLIFPSFIMAFLSPRRVPFSPTRAFFANRVFWSMQFVATVVAVAVARPAAIV